MSENKSKSNKNNKKSNKDKLTFRQRNFLNEYLISLNATQSAIKAGYSPKTAYSQGQRLLKHVEIKKEIEKRMKRARKKEEKKIATAEELLEMFTAFARGEAEEEEIVVVGKGMGYSQAAKVKKQISMRDRIRAAENLAKRYALFTERIEINDTRHSVLDSVSQQIGTKEELEVDELDE